MATICPNCSRPVRQGSIYCSYCGASLTSTAKSEPAAAEVQPAPQLELSGKPPADSNKQTRQTRSRVGRILFIILVLILLIATLIPLFARIWAGLNH